jgi:hypothetical protein
MRKREWVVRGKHRKRKRRHTEASRVRGREGKSNRKKYKRRNKQ